MWSALIGAGAGIAGGIIAGNAAKKAAKKKAALLDKMEQDNENWYSKRINEDYTQTAEAVNAMRLARENADRSIQRAEGVAAVMGGTDESVALQKASASEGVGNTLANISSQATARKNAVESQYLQTKQGIDNSKMAMYDAQAQAAAQAGGQVMGAGMGMVQDYAKYSMAKNMFKA